MRLLNAGPAPGLEGAARGGPWRCWRPWGPACGLARTRPCWSEWRGPLALALGGDKAGGRPRTLRRWLPGGCCRLWAGAAGRRCRLCGAGWLRPGCLRSRAASGRSC